MDTEQINGIFNISKNILTKVFIVLFVLSFLPSLLVLALGNKANKNCTEKVRAVVTDFKEWDGEDGEHSGAVAPVFTYIYNGVTYVSSSESYNSKRKYQEGDEAEILVDPESPEKLADTKDKTSLSVALGFLILPVIIAGNYVLIKKKLLNTSSKIAEHPELIP